MTMNSRARCGVGCGSSGFRMTFLSSGSPGTMAQWSKTASEKACDEGVGDEGRWRGSWRGDEGVGGEGVGDRGRSVVV